MGKTKIVEIALRTAEGFQLIGLLGHADPLEKTTPYFPWIDVFSQLIGLNRATTNEQRRDIVGKIMAKAPKDVCMLY